MFLAGCNDSKLTRSAALKEIEPSLYSTGKLLASVGRVSDGRCASNGGGDYLSFRPDTDIQYVVLQRGGYITVTPDGDHFWNVSLTPKGQALLNAFPRDLHPNRKPDGQNGCSFVMYSFRIAAPAGLEVDQITQETYPVATYMWHWEPTQLGRELMDDGSIYSGLTPKERDYLQMAANSRQYDFAVPLPPKPDVSVRRMAFVKTDQGWSEKM